MTTTNSQEDIHPDERILDEESTPVRVMQEGDLPALLALDAKTSGHSRKTYLEEKFAACVREPGLNTSLVAEHDGRPAGFLMGRLFFGEFGIPSTRAVLDTLGVDPTLQRQNIGQALLRQYQRNMAALRVEAIDTLVDWDRSDLLTFFKSVGFKPSRDVDLAWDLEKYPFEGSGGKAKVRTAWEADLERVVEIDEGVTGNSRSGYIAKRAQAASERPERNRFLVAELDGQVVGYMVARLFSGEFGIDELRGVIEAFAVDEHFGHQGVASAMVEELLTWLQDSQVKRMETLVHWNNWGLLRFFEYIGFRPTARINLEWRF